MRGVTIYPRCVVGARTLVHSGAVIGADGFGTCGGRRSLAKDPAARPRRRRLRRRDRREHDDRPRRDRRYDHRGRCQARQPDPDRPQLRDRRPHGDCGMRRHCRLDAHRPQLPDRRRGDDFRAPRHRRRHHDLGGDPDLPFDRRARAIHWRVSGAAAPRLEASGFAIASHPGTRGPGQGAGSGSRRCTQGRWRRQRRPQ